MGQGGGPGGAVSAAMQAQGAIGAFGCAAVTEAAHQRAGLAGYASWQASAQHAEWQASWHSQGAALWASFLLSFLRSPSPASTP